MIVPLLPLPHPLPFRAPPPPPPRPFHSPPTPLAPPHPRPPQLTHEGFGPLVSELRGLVRLTLRDMPGLSAAECAALEERGRRSGGIVVELQT